MTVAAGWYTDPQNSTAVRWWDGAQWTEHTQPSQPAAEPEVQAVQAAVQQTEARTGTRKVGFFGAKKTAETALPTLSGCSGSWTIADCSSLIKLRPSGTS